MRNIEKPAYTPADLLAMGWPQGRNALYASLKRNEIPSIRVGKKILIPRTALNRFLEAAGIAPAKEKQS